MITSEHAVVRTADPDDARRILQLYDPSYPRSGLLDGHLEMVRPTLDELRAVLVRKDAPLGMLYAIENREGDIRGLCTFRGVDFDASFAEVYIVFAHDEDYAGPLAVEVLDYLRQRIFGRSRIHKMVTRCLDGEIAYRDFLLGQEFESAGVQREVFAGPERWHNQETLVLFNPDRLPSHV